MTRLSLILIALSALALAACGGDEPIGGGPFPLADLEVVVKHPDRETISYRITCLGDTATITGEVDLDEQAACEALAHEDVQRRLIEGPNHEICTEQYGGPDTATITGTIDDFPVDTVVDRANGCGIADWDQLLPDLLPPALGVT